MPSVLDPIFTLLRDLKKCPCPRRECKMPWYTSKPDMFETAGIRLIRQYVSRSAVWFLKAIALLTIAGLSATIVKITLWLAESRRQTQTISPTVANFARLPAAESIPTPAARGMPPSAASTDFARSAAMSGLGLPAKHPTTAADINMQRRSGIVANVRSRGPWALPPSPRW